MKRLFTALKVQPDPEFLLSFQALKDSLKHEKIKWVERHNIHITLKFFGDTPEQQIPEIRRILKQSAWQLSSFEIRLKNLGIFGSAHAPRVIWAGIEPYDELSDLMIRLQENLSRAGFESDRQNLVPHLTLGRIKMLEDKILFKKVLERHQNICSKPFRMEAMILFESILRKEGPEYVVVDRFPFKDAHTDASPCLQGEA